MKNKEEIKQELNKIKNQLERADKLLKSITSRIIKVGKYTLWNKYIDEMRKQLYELGIDVEKYDWDMEWGEE